MKILSQYMNDPFGVTVTKNFEIECEVIRGEDSHVSVNFFNLENGVRMNNHPENNRTFSEFTDFESKTDAEILEILFNLVPELIPK